MLSFNEYRNLLLTEKMSVAAGTFAKVGFDDHAQSIIDTYIKANNIPNPVAGHDLHTTLLYSRRKCEGYCGDPDAKYKANISGLEVWPSPKYGRVLVAKLHAPDLVARHKHLMDKHDATYDHAEYNPHVTLSYDIGDMDHTKLPPFEGQLNMTGETHKDLDLDWKPSK